MSAAGPPLARTRSAGRVPRTGRRLGGRNQELLPALLFIAPALVGFVVFTATPAIRGVVLSFTDSTVFDTGEFIGLDNYIELLSDRVFWNSLGVTAYYVVVNIGVQMVLALLIAVLLERLSRSTIMRAIVMTPYMVSNVVAAMVWLWILDTQMGIFNSFLDVIGLDRINLFGTPEFVIPTLALINVWRFVGYTALLIFAGLQTIPNELYEAGRIDGAGEVRMFRSITLPLLRPHLALVLIMTTAGSFQVFDVVSVTTGGGPANASNVLQMYIYGLAFEQYEFGHATAVSTVLTIILVTIAIVQYRVSRAGRSDLT